MTTPPPDLRARVLAAARAVDSVTRRTQRRRTALALGGALLVLFALAGMHGADGLAARPVGYVVALLSGFMLVVAHMLAPFAAYGRSPLGPARGPLARRARLAPFWLAGLTLLANAVAPATWRLPAAVLGPHARCFGLAAGAGVLVALCALYSLRGSDPLAPRALARSLGVLAGCASGLAMSVACSLSDPCHVLASHVLPVIVLGWLMGVWGARVLRVPSV